MKTNEELKDFCRSLLNRVTNQDDFNAELKKNGINRSAAVTWDKTGRMAMGMIFGIDGKLISF